MLWRDQGKEHLFGRFYQDIVRLGVELKEAV
jgi:hypothetical protein